MYDILEESVSVVFLLGNKDRVYVFIGYFFIRLLVRSDI